MNLGRRLEPLEVEAAKEKQGTRTDKLRGNFPQSSVKGGKSRDAIGKAVGMSGKTYEKAKAVVEAAEEEPEKFETLVEEMNKNGRFKVRFSPTERQKNTPD